MKKKDIAAHVFKRYPKENTVYITSDKQAFFNAEQAEAHAPRLKDKEISVIEREVEDIDVDAETLGDGTNQKPFERISGEGIVTRKTAPEDTATKTDGPLTMANTRNELVAEAAKQNINIGKETKQEILDLLYPPKGGEATGTDPEKTEEGDEGGKGDGTDPEKTDDKKE